MCKTTIDPADVCDKVIIKRGLFYRSKAKGYTGFRDEAGLFTLNEVAELFPNMDSTDQDGISFMSFYDAPEFAPGCSPQDITEAKLKTAKALLSTAKDRIEELEGELELLRDKSQDLSYAIREKAGPLARFGAMVWHASEWPEGGDLDGFELQQMAEKSGILIETEFDPDIHICPEGASERGDQFFFVPSETSMAIRFLDRDTRASISKKGRT